MTKAIFYHAGCPICVSAERQVVSALDTRRYDVEIVHLGQSTDRIDEAKQQGVKSVPALLLDDHVFHINFGATISDLEGSQNA